MSEKTPVITPAGDSHRDPALDPSHHHVHEHLHHSRAASPSPQEDAKYTTHTTFDPPHVPVQSPLSESGKQLGGDAEKGSVISPESNSAEYDEHTVKRKRVSYFYKKYKWVVHAFIFALFTGWWITSLVLYRNERNWVVPFLLYLAIAVRIITFYVPIKIVKKPLAFVWNNSVVRIVSFIPEKLRIPLAALGTLCVFILGSFISEEYGSNTRENRAVSLFGLIVMLFVLWATSKHRRHIQWHTVIVGMLMQFIIGLFVLRTQAGYDIFEFISGLARSLLEFARLGVAFLSDAEAAQSFWVIVGVLPAIIFFIALVQMLYHWGLIQWFVIKFATFFFWSMRVSGAESVVAAASPFIGQGESAMLIRPFIPHLTKAEIHQVMCSGFATIAGSVLVAYLGMGVSPQALISSCVMSIPASIAVSKLRYPETEESLTAGKVIIPDDDEHNSVNSLHAFANGSWLGLKIAGMIASSLLCILAVVGLIDGLLGWWGSYISINDPRLSIELIVGYLCYPIAFLLGVPRTGDIYKVARLIGVKLIQNEFVAFSRLQSADYADLDPRSRLISTYAICGFANLGSLGIQIGVLSQLSPSRSGDVSKIAFSALITGAISTLTSAAVAGLLITDPTAYLPPLPVAGA